MSDNPKPTQNDALSFELTDWLDHTQKLDQNATGKECAAMRAELAEGKAANW